MKRAKSRARESMLGLTLPLRLLLRLPLRLPQRLPLSRPLKLPLTLPLKLPLKLPLTPYLTLCLTLGPMLAPMLLAGCASAARDAAFRREEAALYDARRQAAVRCGAEADCAAAWARTRAFVAAHSATRIIHADDTLIVTAMPHAFGFVYLAAMQRATDQGDTLIQLKAMCRGMYDTNGTAGPLYATCADSIVAIEAEYRAWMKAGR